MLTFSAELKEVKQSKSASTDNVYSLKFLTHNPMILHLGKLPCDTLFKVTVDIENANR